MQVTQLPTGITDDLTEAQYREIYDELRQRMTLRQFATAINSAVSFAWWSQYEHGSVSLAPARRAELRAAVDLPALPEPAAAVIGSRVIPDAIVYQVGAAPADRVVLVGHDTPDELSLRFNGTLHADCAPAEISHVTEVTRQTRPATRGTVHLERDLWQRLNTARLASGLSWPEYLQRLLTEE